MSKENRKIYRSQIGTVKAAQSLRQTIELSAARQAEQENRKQEKAVKTTKKRWRYALVPALVLVLVFAMLFGSAVLPTGTASAAENLMDGIVPSAQAATACAADDRFIRAQADFSVKLLQKASVKGKNSLVSPFSVASALSMTANGASGQTLQQFQQLLGGGIGLDDLNRQYFDMGKRLTQNSGKLKSANSIWYGKGRVTVQKEFLQRNADYYGAGAYQLDFSNAKTASLINGWVKEKTGGKIDSVVQSIAPETVLYLINALYFEDDWAHPYYPYGDKNFEDFSTPSGKVRRQFLGSFEDYIHGDGAEGIIKPFKDKRYAFVAVLPEEGTDLDSYVGSLTGEKFMQMMNSKDKSRQCLLPKFKYDYSVSLSDSLKSLGLTDAFDAGKADFSKMGTSPNGPLFIGGVLHKTFIQVDEAGAKAGAVTVVTMATGSSGPPEHKIIVFNRPFVIGIIDTQTKLPIFLGTVTDPVQ